MALSVPFGWERACHYLWVSTAFHYGSLGIVPDYPWIIKSVRKHRDCSVNEQEFLIEEARL